MERSSSSAQDKFLSSNTSLSSLKDNSESSFMNDTHSNSSIYDSAVENSSSLRSLSNSVSTNNNSTQSDSIAATLDSSSISSLMNSTLSINENPTLNDSISSSSKSDFSGTNTFRNGSNSDIKSQHNIMMMQSGSTDTNTSQEEVDPKSQLANKTIFKTDNPNLSIIEINDDIHGENAELENSVLVIEEPNDKMASTPARRSPSTVSSSGSNSSTSGVSSDTSAEKRRKKTESLLHSSKQKLDISIAEASANEFALRSGAGAGGAGDADTTAAAAAQNISECDEEAIMNQTNDANSSGQLQTRREIKIYDTIDEFEKNLPSTVTVLDTPFGSKVYLVGTAHFSEESQDDVSYVIRNVRPDVVMVELCPSRIHILKLDERTLLEEAKNFNLSKIRGIIHAHGYINGVFFIMLLQLSAQIAKDLGMAPGGEFRRAFEEIQRLPGCMLHLGDRPIRITLHRALRALSFWQTLKLVVRLISNETISIAEVEECKQKDLLEKLMQEMAGEFPAFSDVFVTERDMFLCHSLQVASLPQTSVNGVPRPVRVVGVVGIGHAKGIAKMWGRVDPEKIPEIMQIPPASLSTRLCTSTLKYGVIGIVLFGAYKVLRPRVTGLF